MTRLFPARLLLLPILSAALFAGCSTDEELVIYTLVSEQIVASDTTMTVTVRLENKQTGVFGSDSDVVGDATVRVNGDTLAYNDSQGAFQRGVEDLRGLVEVVVERGAESHSHAFNLQRLTVNGFPLPEDSPIEPRITVSWDAPNPATGAAVELIKYEDNTFNPVDGDLIRGSSPLDILLPDKYLNSYLRVIFYYNGDLATRAPFEEVTYYLTQQSDVTVGD